MSKTIFKVKFGSHLYGTNTPESDTDYKGVYVPSSQDIIMQRIKPVIVNSTGSDTQKNTSEDIDDELFSIGKFMSMLRTGDMIAAELLFVPRSNALIWDEDWNYIVRNRKKLIDRNISGFVGYIRAQVNKYGIKGSRVATARAAVELFDVLQTKHGHRSKLNSVRYDLYDEFVSVNEHCLLYDILISKDNDRYVPCIEILNRKLPMTISFGEAYKIMNRLFVEYGARALAAEREEGVDWKAVYHAVRVSEQAIELLEHRKITFPRQNVDDLLKIRRGEYKFKEIAERIENNMLQLEDLMTKTQLRNTLDEKFMDQVVEDLHVDSVIEGYGVDRWYVD